MSLFLIIGFADSSRKFPHEQAESQYRIKTPGKDL